jgi:16S rRNA (cytosine967-C5)-methyltransferase
MDAGYLPVTESTVPLNEMRVEADRFAAEAVMQGAHLYARGVRNCKKLKAGMSVTVVDPSGTPVGSGIARQSETSILRYHQGIAVEILHSRFLLPSMRETSWYEAGLIHLQSLPAMVTCQVLDPKPGEVIVDLNCAPAGKMSYLCQLTKNKARIIGFDRNEEKIGKAREHLERLRCENYQLIAHDSRYAHLDYKFNADRVLVDPPCTGLGVMPKLSIETTKRDIENLSSYQKQFMTTAAALVKEGGTVVYSVCTVTGEECEEVARFAEEKLGLIKVAANPIVGRSGLDSENLTQRFDPELDGAGYFIARFVKP